MILRGLKLALVMALVALSSALAQNAPTVTIARLAGTVEVAHRDVDAGAWRAATQGQAIGSGWKLRTGKGGKVQLTFPRNNTVVLKENSVLYVDKLDAGGGAKVKSDKGGFLFQLKNALGSGSTFEVDTPAALATVRGTEFAVLLGGDTVQGGVAFEAVEIAHEGLKMQGAANDSEGGGGPAEMDQAEVQSQWDRLARGEEPMRLGDLDGDGRADVVLADLDGDGLLDIVVLSGGGDGGLALTGRPVGQPAAAGLGSNVQRSGIPAGDLDGDGLPDLVIPGEGASEDSGADATETLRLASVWDSFKDSALAERIAKDIRDGSIDGIDALIADGWITGDSDQVFTKIGKVPYLKIEMETIEFRSGMDSGIRKSAPSPPGGTISEEDFLDELTSRSVFEDGRFEQWAEQQDADGDGILDYLDDDDDGDGVPDADDSSTERSRIWDSRSEIWSALRQTESTEGGDEVDDEDTQDGRSSDDGVIGEFTWTQTGGPYKFSATTLHGYEGTVDVENEHGSSKLTDGTSIFAVGNDPPQAVPSGPDAEAFRDSLKDFFETGDVPTEEQFGDLLDSYTEQLAGLIQAAQELEAELQVFQNNQTDLDFLRQRAGRIGELNSTLLQLQGEAIALAGEMGGSLGELEDSLVLSVEGTDLRGVLIGLLEEIQAALSSIDSTNGGNSENWDLGGKFRANISFDPRGTNSIGSDSTKNAMQGNTGQKPNSLEEVAAHFDKWGELLNTVARARLLLAVDSSGSMRAVVPQKIPLGGTVNRPAFDTGDVPIPDQFDLGEFRSRLAEIEAQLAEAEEAAGAAATVADLTQILIGLSTAAEALEQLEVEYLAAVQLHPADAELEQFGEDLGRVKVQFSILDNQLNQVSQVIVRGWDPREKQPIVGRIDRELTRIHDEWRRYESNDQTTQMLFLWKQVLELHDELHEFVSGYDRLHRLTRGHANDHSPDEIEQMLTGPFRFDTPAGTLSPSELSDLLPAVQSLLLPAVQSLLLPAVQSYLEALGELDEQVLSIHNRMEEMSYEVEPLLIDNEDLRELLRGLIDSGDPVLGLRWQNIDTDNDGLSDVAEIALGLDPLVSNDDGFIELIEPDDHETFEFPQDRSITFGFEPLDTDAIEEYTLVLEADGRRFTRRGARGFDRVELEQLVGPGGAFADSVGPDGALEVEWFVTGRIDQRAIGALDGNPSLRLGEIESEHRSFTIQFPVQRDPIILDLNEQGVAPQVGGMVRVRGSISEVNSLGEWEIRVAYDPQVLQFERGQRLGMFATATVFFGEQGGGIVVISGSAPRGTGGGLSGEGDIFELEFTALEAESTFVEGDDLILRDSFDNDLDAEFGTDASIDIEEARGTNRRDPDGEFFQGGSLLRQ